MEDRHMDWLVKNFRATIFLDQDDVVDAYEIWMNTVNHVPQLEVLYRLESISHLEGIYKNIPNSKLVLKSTDKRIDLELHCSSEVGEAKVVKFNKERDYERASLFPSLGQFEDVKSEFLKLVEAFVKQESFSKIVRIAFAVKLMTPTDNKKDGYRILSNMLKPVSVSKNAKDFSFRINYPQKSKHSQCLEINCISNWSVETLISSGFQIDMTTQMTKQSPRFEQTFCILDLDINTVYRDDGINKSDVLLVFQELIAIALTTSIEGVLDDN